MMIGIRPGSQCTKACSHVFSIQIEIKYMTRIIGRCLHTGLSYCGFRTALFLNNLNFWLILSISQTTLNKAYLILSHTGEHPKQSRGSLVRVYEVPKIDPKQWGYRVLGHKGNEFTLAVQSAPDAIVGSWTVFVNLGFQDDEGKQQNRRNKLQKNVTLLFNTWCGGKCEFC